MTVSNLRCPALDSIRARRTMVLSLQTSCMWLAHMSGLLEDGAFMLARGYCVVCKSPHVKENDRVGSRGCFQGGVATRDFQCSLPIIKEVVKYTASLGFLSRKACVSPRKDYHQSQDTETGLDGRREKEEGLPWSRARHQSWSK